MRRTLSRSILTPGLAVIGALALASLALAPTACSSSTPNPDDPSHASTEHQTSDATPPEEHDPGEATTQLAMPAGTAKKSDQDERIPDDYTMTAGDCQSLGEKLTETVRRENTAQIDPRVNAKRREEAEENIERVATKLGGDFTSMCNNGMVGKVVDRAALKCAMDAATAKAFEACLGGDAPDEAPKAPKKK